MKAVQVPHAGGAFELVERPLPEPQEGQVRIKVQACGICHSDSLVKEGGPYPITYPRVPSHEVIGVIDAVGTGVRPWSAGQRVGRQARAVVGERSFAAAQDDTGRQLRLMRIRADKSAAPLPGADEGRHGEPAPTAVLSPSVRVWLIAYN